MDEVRDSLLVWFFTSIVPAAPAIIQAVLVVVVAVYAGRRLTEGFRTRATRSAMDPSTVLLGSRLIHIAILVLGLIVFLDAIGIPLSTLLATIGVIGLAISLALQELLRNVFSGIYLLFERPFRIGDTIRVKDHEGVVHHVGLRTLMLKTPQDAEVLIPNSLVVSEVVTNLTRVRRQAPMNEGTGTGTAPSQ